MAIDGDKTIGASFKDAGVFAGYEDVWTWRLAREKSLGKSWRNMIARPTITCIWMRLSPSSAPTFGPVRGRNETVLRTMRLADVGGEAGEATGGPDMARRRSRSIHPPEGPMSTSAAEPRCGCCMGTSALPYGEHYTYCPLFPKPLEPSTDVAICCPYCKRSFTLRAREEAR